MAEQGQRRKLAAILSADVVGYSRLMGDDESATVATLKTYRAAVERVVEQHHGRVVNAPGDNMLAEFPGAVEAVQAAVEIQRNIEGRNAEVPEDRRMHFRVGLNLGDVIEEDDGTIYGDGVNIAARMEALADSGGICIASTIYDAVEGKLDYGFDFLGGQQVKNVEKPINVYRVRAEPGTTPAKPAAGTSGRRAIARLALNARLLTCGCAPPDSLRFVSRAWNRRTIRKMLGCVGRCGRSGLSIFTCWLRSRSPRSSWRLPLVTQDGYS